MHLFAVMAVYFILFSVCMLKHERVRTYVLISQFSTKISVVDFWLFFKNCYSTVIFRLLFQKLLWLLAHFYVVAEVEDFERLYAPLIAQR